VAAANQLLRRQTFMPEAICYLTGDWLHRLKATHAACRQPCLPEQVDHDIIKGLAEAPAC
jgi:hypothetical protein